jgi:PAS domain S-box-containing protein
MLDRIQVLLVEDSARDAELVVAELRRSGFNPEWRRVDTAADYLAALHPTLDVVISDFSMPKFNGLRALDLLRQRDADIPFIIVSGVIGEETAVMAIKHGATDYLLKDRMARLGPAVSQALEQRRLRREVKKSDLARSETEYNFRVLFDAANDPIYMLHDGIFVDCNVKGQNIYGRTRDEIIGHAPTEFAPVVQPDGQNSHEKAIKIIQRAIAGEPQSFEWTSLHKDGSEVQSDVSLNRLELGNKIYLMAVARDSTERKRAETQIAEQAAFLDKARDAIIVRDLEGKILFWNAGAERVYGWKHDEVIGRNVLEILRTDPALFGQLSQQIFRKGEWHGELHHLTKDQREIVTEVNCTLIRDGSGQPKSVLSINTDITAKKEIEAQFMRAQRMESIGALAGGVAHDLNNILAPILMSIETLKFTSENSGTAKILDSIEASAKRGAYIVRQLLSFARGLEGHRVEVQPCALLDDLEKLLRDTFPKDIRLQFCVPNETWPILGDPTQVHQILLNLCLNARDAMPGGGTLTVTVADRQITADDIDKPIEADAGRYVQFSVNDSGLGIPHDVLPRIFEPFFTTKEFNKGTGLGLSTVMAIVKSHNGFLHVESAPAHGTTFEVFLPACEFSAENQKEPAEALVLPRGKGETVLIVDDEASILAVTTHTLETFGYRTLSASNGAEALAIYAQFAGEIAAVLTDMAMPVMDGATTIRGLRQINPNIRIIASSGLTANGTIAKASEAGTKHFLAKPYTADMLLKTLRSTLDETPIGK